MTKNINGWYTCRGTSLWVPTNKLVYQEQGRDSMKKVICMLLLLSFLLCGCFPEIPRETKLPANWKDVFIEDCGTLAVPGAWEYSVEDGIMYFTKNGKPVMISYDGKDEVESNAYFSDFKFIDTITSAFFSNGAMYGRKELSYQGEKIERCFLKLDKGKIEYETCNFIVWDTSVQFDTVKKIAELFEPAPFE